MIATTRIVLDTNVVLDWLVFRDLRIAPGLDASVGAGRPRWIASAAMRDEFVEVLRRGLAERTGVSVDAALAGWSRHATLLPPAAPAAGWRCRDTDDQKFIALSLACGARWLLPRDRDLLALASRTVERGLTIATPAAWIAAGG